MRNAKQSAFVKMNKSQLM